MITLYTIGEIQEVSTLSQGFKEELRRYFREITEGIVGEAWESYSLDEVGPILAIEKEDTIDILDEYGLMQGSKTVPVSLPEFATRVMVDGKKMLRIIWVCNDSFGLSVYYPIGQFGKEFDSWIAEYIID